MLATGLYLYRGTLPHLNHQFRVSCSSGEKWKSDEVLVEREAIAAGGGVPVIDKIDKVEEEEEETGKWWLKGLPKRYKLIGATCLAFVVCNMDKVNLSIAIIPMSHQFGWNSTTARLVQSSFSWGYALSQLPGGWLAKLFGGRKVLEVGVALWSLATAVVPVVAGFMPALFLSRVMAIFSFTYCLCVSARPTKQLEGSFRN